MNAAKRRLCCSPSCRIRAVIGLGVLRAHRAEAALTALFDAERSRQIEALGPSVQPGDPDEWYPSAMLYLVQALWRIRPEARWPLAAIEVLTSEHDWVFRHEAILALDGVNEPVAVQALTCALGDAEPLVRHGAARALLKLCGLPVDITDPQVVTIRVMCRDAGRREAARREILATIAGRTMTEQ